MMNRATPIRLEPPSGQYSPPQFWYWQGVSGKRYIHSVYDPQNCPPLPGAIFVAVKRNGIHRTAIAVDRFRTVLDRAKEREWMTQIADLGADEIHVHLMAKSHDHAETILNDLRSAIEFEVSVAA